MLKDLKEAASTIRKGGIILYPSDTIWGIGCDASNEKAVKRIYMIKKRCDKKSMLVLLDAESKLKDYVSLVPPIAHELISVTEKPLTIIYPKAKNIAANLVSGDGSIGIRIANDDFCIRLIRMINKPLVSTSANISGMPPPQNFSLIDERIKTSVDYVVKWRQNETSPAKPSKIIRLIDQDNFEVIRE